MNKKVFVEDVVAALEQFAPSYFQESFDNSGLLIGDKSQQLTSVLLCVDVTENIIEEAISLGANMIVSHHPVIFSGLKKITGSNATERIVLKAIKSSIAIYCGHTNFDSVRNGISFKIGEKLSLSDMKVLSLSDVEMCKVVVFAPLEFKSKIIEAMCVYGGVIGEYDNCSYCSLGEGSFRPSNNATPYVGNIGKINTINECKIEVIVAQPLIESLIESVKMVHPYSEIGYDVYPLKNKNNSVGLGVVGNLSEEVDALEFLKKVKDIFNCGIIRHSSIKKDKIKRVALCGGSGAEFVDNAINERADIYLSADFKYHNFFVDSDKITVADFGHFESEECIIEIFYDIISKKIPNFAIHCTKIKSNPINYL